MWWIGVSFGSTGELSRLVRLKPVSLWLNGIVILLRLAFLSAIAFLATLFSTSNKIIVTFAHQINTI